MNGRMEPGAINGATASWTAAALCRFPTHLASESGRALPQSKTSRTYEDSGTFNGLMPPFIKGSGSPCVGCGNQMGS